MPDSLNSNNNANRLQINGDSLSITVIGCSEIGLQAGSSIVSDHYVRNRDEFTTGIAQTVRTAGFLSRQNGLESRKTGAHVSWVAVISVFPNTPAGLEIRELLIGPGVFRA